MIYSLMALVFVLGYIAIALEHNVHVDKAASALLTAIIIWTLLVFGADTLLAEELAQSGSLPVTDLLNSELRHHLAEIAEILFFLMGAMVIVELIDAHDGFYAITSRIRTTSAIKLLWTIGTLTFFFSALLDNLTTTIVMVSLLRKLIEDKQMRWWYVGMVVVCANAGGAWSPIGDVTTTMLWIGSQVTASKIIVDLIVPSLIAAVVPLSILSIMFRGKKIVRPKPVKPIAPSSSSNYLGDDGKSSGIPATYMESPLPSAPEGSLPKNEIAAFAQRTITNKMRVSVLALGLSALAFVPIFKTVTHLPPYMGILFGVGVLWIFTEVIHRHHDWYVKERMTVVGVLTRVDMPSILFFLGILLAVAGLATAGHLTDVALWLDNTFGNLYVINVLIGLLSSLVDNVPLVAGAMKMYPLLTDASVAHLSGAELARQSQFLQDGAFWHFLAYCAGTGGSCLIIGSAAGVAAMGMEKVPFMWYLKRISGLALIGYLAGAAAYILIHVV
ncbi:sodium:proton antiporter NhaD [Psychrobacter sp. FDAARGOS_221]|uniref:sodium:proton antiporter NhaD n=1 Tax=Psychrobacter sp. FDAARGOS_221 TaxID=1975705 RepID=UPI000BB598CB|nr:sodium:proton antiporter NhaD [Psychrobacter sp. FDAARGOS_221]PNK60649.1 sodium:proton antiporter [Psychrobacter sp. FDAARGOS_221]